MNVRQFRYSSDNLGYLIYGKNTAIAVDGGASDRILDFLRDRGLKLEIVTNTHSHGDHTLGNDKLLKSTGARYLSSVELAERGVLTLEGQVIDVIPTPGHSADSLCLLCRGTLLSGDTLFNGKVGRCFTGDYRGFFDSISKLMELPGETLVMGGHDYVQEYMEFARMVQPENSAIDPYLGRYDPQDISYTLAEEREVDPFLRLEDSEVISFFENRGLPSTTVLQRFTSLFGV